MKLLVTGASGIAGTKLCHLASNRQYRVFSAYDQHVPLFGTPTRLDVTDRQAMEKVFERTSPDAVIHAAALTDVDKCEREKETALKTNAEATGQIAELCRRHRSFLVYVSTDYVFNGEKGMYKETDPPNPVNNYGLTKLAGEKLVQQSSAEHCVARTSVIYGANAATGKANFTLWLLERLRQKEWTKIVTDQWNSPTLNTNLAEMILEIVERKITGTFHLSGATRISRFEFAKKIANIFDEESSHLIPVPSTEMQWIAKRPEDSSLDVSRASSILNAKPLELTKALKLMRQEMHSGEAPARAN